MNKLRALPVFITNTETALSQNSLIFVFQILVSRFKANHDGQKVLKH